MADTFEDLIKELNTKSNKSTKAKKTKHVHKYFFKFNPPGYLSVWACALPNCTHYMPTHMIHFMEGKNSICWSCNEEHRLDLDSMQCKSEFRENVLEPLCANCRSKREGNNLDKIRKMLENL